MDGDRDDRLLVGAEGPAGEERCDGLAPFVMASWGENSVAKRSNPEFVGGKASGLFRLPNQWVPPFLVLTSAFHSAWKQQQTVAGLMAGLPDREQALMDHFFDHIVPTHSPSAPMVMVRSNSTLEDLTVRGVYESFLVPANREHVYTAISAVLAASRGEKMCVLLQPCMNPSWAGHMSNERRVSASENQWLVEGLIEGEPWRQQFVRAAPASDPKPLAARTRKALTQCLRQVAGALTAIPPRRFHCEWVWSRHQLWIVQADPMTEAKMTPEVTQYLQSSDIPVARYRPTSVLLHFRDIDSDAWRKLRRPKEFDRLGLPTADVYILTGDQWLDLEQRQALLAELGQMCKNPLVVRCDVAAHVSFDETLLPTSPAISDLDQLVQFLDNTAAEISSKGLDRNDWAFLLAYLVAARASVMVHAQPSAQRVQIDAIWGFPDGLLHFPHDTWFYYPNSGSMKEVRRYKGVCLLPHHGAWAPEEIGEPFDWEPALGKDEIKVLADWALRLSTALGREIELMGLARIGGARGAHACLPWHYTDWAVPPYTEALRALPSASGLTVIRAREDLHNLRTSTRLHQARGIFVRPAPDLLRDSPFLVEVATLAARTHKPIYFEGSLLGHAYYIMKHTGAVVVPVATTDLPRERKQYHKLVRDRIPMIIEESGGLARVRQLPRENALALLKQKLVEEALEVWNAAPGGLTEELADVLEVVDAIRSHSGIDREGLEETRKHKRDQRGGFDELFYLEETSIRTLREIGDGGRFPLFTATPSLPSEPRSAPKDIDLMPTENPLEIIRFRIPLVPPVRLGGQPRLSGETAEAKITVDYIRDKLVISLHRPQPKPSDLQLQLFPELTMELPDSG